MVASIIMLVTNLLAWVGHAEENYPWYLPLILIGFFAVGYFMRQAAIAALRWIDSLENSN